RCRQSGHNVQTCQSGKIGSNPKNKPTRTEVNATSQQLPRSGGVARGFSAGAETSAAGAARGFSAGAGTSAAGGRRSTRSTRSQGFFRHFFPDAQARQTATASTASGTTNNKRKGVVQQKGKNKK
ncbi:hypothetical protein MKW94_005414, partial [Papaver nudicaule]|nr:hypothetical protein [Papaver nudicaule]